MCWKKGGSSVKCTQYVGNETITIMSLRSALHGQYSHTDVKTRTLKL